MTPVTRRTAETMIAQLTAATAQRAETGSMSEVKLDLFVDCLLRHPADVATTAIKQLATEPRANGGTAWFPTLPELEGVCRQLSGDRASMLQGLQAWQEPPARDAKRDALAAMVRDCEGILEDCIRKTGPGPTIDVGERGERLETENIARKALAAARDDYAEYLNKRSDR